MYLSNYIYAPLEQFEVILLKPLSFFNRFDCSFTIVSLYTIIVCFSMFLFFYLATLNSTLLPNSWQYIVESLYKFIAELVGQQVGFTGQKYFPLLFFLFLFILMSNLTGMTPYGFTITSQIIQTFGLSLTMWTGLTIVGFLNQKLGYLKLLVPSGAPIYLIPLLVCIETVSYFFRALSLAIRLFANMMAGHTLLNVMSSFIIKLSKVNLVLGLFPLIIVIAITFLELSIAFLQAYVFVVLCSIYLHDSYHAGH